MSDRYSVGPIITRPTDPERVRRLRRKLDEYQRRYDSDPALLDTLYKLRLLSALLEHGQVNIIEMEQTLLASEGRLDFRRYDRACTVINDYAETGGLRNWGGTGLPE